MSSPAVSPCRSPIKSPCRSPCKSPHSPFVEANAGLLRIQTVKKLFLPQEEYKVEQKVEQELTTVTGVTVEVEPPLTDAEIFQRCKDEWEEWARYDPESEWELDWSGTWVHKDSLLY